MRNLLGLVWTVLRVVILLALIVGLPYLLIAFVEWSLDPSVWAFWSRAVLALAYAGMLVFAAVLAFAPDGKGSGVARY